jgi:carbon monoxide dehydrogenase subunit G
VNVEGTRTFAAPRDTVWHVLNDPQSMAELMPGVESFDVADDRHWTANVKIPLGLGGLRMKINFEKLEERPPEHARLHAKGQGVGALLDMTTQFDLAEADGGTAMRWQADVKIAGTVGSMGQRVLQPIVNQQVQHVLNALDRQVQRAKADGGGAEGEQPLLDEGPPAGTTPEPAPGAETGSSGAEEGISPLSPEGYDEDPSGPTQSTEDRG